MDKLHIFKFKDTVDLNSAFIIAGCEETARKILENETSIHFYLDKSVFLEDIPKALEHWNETKNPIYINRILPF